MCRNGIPARLLALIAAIPLAVGLLAAGPLGLGGTGVALAAPPAGASDWGGIAEGQVRLIAGVSAAGEKSAGTEQAGETKAGDESALPFGLQFRMAKGWKIYWRSPGDAGYPPHLDWTGSENLGAADLLWPAPMRFGVLGFGGLASLLFGSLFLLDESRTDLRISRPMIFITVGPIAVVALVKTINLGDRLRAMERSFDALELRAAGARSVFPIMLC